MNKLGIVILNYLNWHDTIECVLSLKNQTNKNFEIVIVDNASNNQSFENIQKKFKDFANVHILKTEENLGYARGNNIGIRYCIEILNINNVLIVNNDTLFNDDSYIEFLLNINTGKSIGAVGTKIIGSDGKNQNPIYTPVNYKSVLKSIIIGILNLIGLGKILGKTKNIKDEFSEKKNMKGDSYILHGASILLTENYLKKAQGFYPKTFLYYEEYILGILMNKMNLDMKYIDDVHIYHKEDQSSALSFDNKSRVMYKYQLKSARIALGLFNKSIIEITNDIKQQ